MTPVKMNFKTINQVEVAKKSSWENNIFITIDIDWASDEVLEKTIRHVEEKDVPVTWFITHDTPLLKELQGNKKFELGIHPNFNGLFEGNTKDNLSAKDILHRLLEIVPNAVSVRSHSLAHSFRLLDLFKESGLKYHSNYCIPLESNTIFFPWYEYNGLINVPHCWSDWLIIQREIDLLRSKPIQRDRLNVFLFHPIHLVLNTNHMSLYEKARSILRDNSNREEFKKLIYPGVAIKQFFDAVIEKTEIPIYENIINWQK